MKIFVTGAEGCVGHKLIHRLANQGHEVHAFTQQLSEHPGSGHPLIKIFNGSLADRNCLAAAMKTCTQVYHTSDGCNVGTKNKAAFYEQNIGNTINVLDTAIECGVEKFVYTSNCSSWSPSADHLYTENDPRITSFDNDYDLSKHLAEKIVQDYGQKGLYTVIVNLSFLYGPEDGFKNNIVNRVVNLLLNGRIAPLPWQLDIQANYAFIDDVVNGHILAMEKGTGGERYILGGENISYRDMISMLKENYSPRKLFIRTPGFVFNSGRIAGFIRARLTSYEPLLTTAMAKRFFTTKTFDCTKAIKQLGYHVTPFSTGIKATINYLTGQSK